MSSQSTSLEKAIQNEIEKQMEEAPPNEMLTLQEKRAKIEQKVRESLNFEDYGKWMKEAFKIMGTEDDLKEWAAAASQNLKNLKGVVTEEKMKGAFALSQEIQGQIQKLAISKFTNKDLEGCLALFYFLANAVADEPDYWYRLGIVAEKSGNFPLALQAFTSVEQLAPDFIGGHLFASNCDLHMGKKEEAKAELEEARRCFKNLEEKAAEDWQLQLLEVEHQIKVA